MKTVFSLFTALCATLSAAATPDPDFVQTIDGDSVPNVRRATPVDAGLFREDATDVDTAAQFIAGLQPSVPGTLADLTAAPEWRAYAKELDSAWQSFDQFRLRPIRAWMPQALSGFRPETVFYPFSGPDYIYARTYFPDATTYVLCGLEPVGVAPSPQNVQPLALTLGWMRLSTKTFLEAGYFITKEMRVQFKQSPLQGTVPVICLMMARSGDRILSVKTDATHAEIRFSPLGDNRVRTLHYFSLNLSNDALRKNKTFLDFVAHLRPDVGYLKSASYLLHESEFSLIRDTLLANCPAILQDDSGIPLKAFAPACWRLANFGVYVNPLDIFKKYTQPDLAAFYEAHPSERLTFGVGYHWDPKTANLMLARRAAP
jgi:hypothetical protein